MYRYNLIYLRRGPNSWLYWYTGTRSCGFGSHVPCAAMADDDDDDEGDTRIIVT